MPTSESEQYDLLDQLAEEFAARFRRGERPALREYTDRYPELAGDIRELFPAMVKVEQAGDARQGEDEKQPRSSRAANPPLTQIGDYRVLREIGRGGMGVVYEAEQISLGRRVALKVLPGQASSDRLVQERFRREARAAARLHHTNIVPVYDVGQDGDVRYYAMQFIEGQGLDLVITELRRLLDRARSQSKLRAASGGRSLRPSGEQPPQCINVPTQGDVAEVSPVLRSILTGRFDSSSRGLELAGASGPMRARTKAEGLTTPRATGTESRVAEWGPALTSTEAGSAAAGGSSGTQRAHPPGPALSPSTSPSSSSAILPGGAQLSSVESGHRAFFRALAQIGRQVAGGLAYAHVRGIVHRDIKPSNLLLDTEGVAWIADFGLAKGEDEGLTQSGDILGTLRYMAPERFRGEGDARADVYALGLTLYELLTLSPAFDSADRLKLIELIKTAEPPKPRTIDARIPRDLETIVLKAIEKAPKARYQSAEAMGEDLRRFLADEPIKARQVSTSERYWRWAKRNPAVATLGGALAAVLVLVTIGSLLAAGRFAKTATAERGARLEADQARSTAETARTAAQIAEQEMKKFAAQANADKNVAQQETERAEAEKKRAEEQLTRAEWLVYAGKLMLAQNDFEAGNGGLALHYLDECQWNLRGWEHRYLWTRVSARQTLVGHAGEVWSVAFSPDGKRIVTGSWDKAAKVWDAGTGQELLTLKGHICWITSAAFSPDGKRIVTGAGEWGYPGRRMQTEAKVWDAGTGQELLALDGHTAPVWSVAFSPDGQRIVTGSSDGMVRVWGAENGREVLVLKSDGEVSSAAFSPDGKRIVTGGGTAKVWDAGTGHEVLALKGHTGGVRGVAFSPDGKRIVTGSDDQTAKIWDVGTGQEIHALKGHSSWVWSVAFSPDGTRIITGSWDQTTKVWDAGTGQEIHALKGHAGYVRSVAFSPDGRRIVTGSDDQTAKVWDAEKGQEVPTLKTGGIFSAAFSPDGQRIVTGGDGRTVKVWNAGTGQEVVALDGHTNFVCSVAFSPDGKRIVTGSWDRTARVWDAESGREYLVLKGHTASVNSVAFSPDGKRVVTGAGKWPNLEPGEAKVWDAENGHEHLVLKEHRAGVSSAAFSPDGKRIVTGSFDQTAKVWDAEDGHEYLVLKGHTAAVYCVAFSPDGKRIVTGSFDQTAKVWDAENGHELFPLKGHTGNVRSVAFSLDGQRIVTGGDDRAAKVWDAETGQEVLAIKGHPLNVWSAAFSPDGQRLVTGGLGNPTVKVWHAGAGQEVLVLEGHTDTVTSVAFSADSKRIFAWDAQKKVLAWSAADGQPMGPVDPPPAPPPGPARSPDGFRRAVPLGKTVAVTDKRPPPKDNAWPLPDGALRKRYHTAQAALAERENQWFAAEFHLRRVLGDDPDNATVKTRLIQIPQKIARDQK